MGEDHQPSSPSRSSDGSSSSPPRPPISYSATALLALYKSPLVPAKLQGMKELSEWYGEYSDPPSSPPSRARDMHGTPSRTNSSHTSGLSAGGRPNPFANFGRFGVDGGLEGEAIAGKLWGDKRRGGDRDAAPHLGASSESRRDNGRGGSRLNGLDRDGDLAKSSKDSTGFFSNERERSERMRARGEVTVNGGRERREENVKRDRRAPDEGGWRSVGGPGDRERRLGRGNSSNTTNDSRDTRGDSRRERDRDGEPRNGNRRGQPSWMDDEPSSSSHNSPAWMDAPATGGMSFGSGNVIEKERASGGMGLGGGSDGVDSIQAWKQQMKEMERREREKEEGVAPSSLKGTTSSEPATNGNSSLPSPPEPTSSSVLNGLLGIGNSDKTPQEPKPSVFGDLISNGSTSGSASAGGNGGGETGRGGGRGSRFAKFFDGKPPGVASPPPQAQPQPSVFESLMGVSAGSTRNAGSPGPSKEDADSMARLLGMLQVSSARAHSPETSRNPAPSAPSPNVVSAIPTPQQAVSPAPTSASLTSDRRQGGGSSRFAFSQPSSQPSSQSSSQPHQQQSHQSALPSQQPQQPQQQQQQQPLQSPPLQPYGGAPQSFGFPPQSQQQHHQQQAPQSPPEARSSTSSLPAHSRSASTHNNSNATSPPLGHNQHNGSQGPPPPQQPHHPPPFMQGPPGAPNNLPPHLMNQQGAASRPLPPPNNGPGRPDFPQQQQPNGMPHIPMSMAPNGRPMPPQMFSPPPHPNDLPAHLRGMNQPGMPPPQQFGRPPLPPGQAPPPFMMYGGPPPPHGMYGGPPPPQFRGGPPMPPPMGGGMGHGGPGVPDLMALLNSGGGGAMRGPPPPQQPSPHQYMPMEQQRQ